MDKLRAAASLISVLIPSSERHLMGKPGTAAASSRSSSGLFCLKLTVTEIWTQGRTPQPPSLCSFPKYYSNKLGLLLVTFKGQTCSHLTRYFSFFVSRFWESCLWNVCFHSRIEKWHLRNVPVAMSWSRYVIQILDTHEPLLFKCPFQCFEARQRHAVYLHCVQLEADVLEANISRLECFQLKPPGYRSTEEGRKKALIIWMNCPFTWSLDLVIPMWGLYYTGAHTLQFCIIILNCWSWRRYRTSSYHKDYLVAALGFWSHHMTFICRWSLPCCHWIVDVCVWSKKEEDHVTRRKLHVSN